MFFGSNTFVDHSQPSCFSDSLHLKLDMRQHEDNLDTIFILVVFLL